MASAELFTVIEWRDGGLSVLPRNAHQAVFDRLHPNEAYVGLMSRDQIDRHPSGRPMTSIPDLGGAKLLSRCGPKRKSYGAGPRKDRRVWDDRAALQLMANYPDGIAIEAVSTTMGIPLSSAKRQIKLLFEEGLVCKLRVGKTWHVQLTDDGRAAL